MRPRTSSAVDGESLQADVMRFMAIIAFCLVAIMALVRDVAPPNAPAAAAAAPAPVTPAPATPAPVASIPATPQAPAVKRAAVPKVAANAEVAPLPERQIPERQTPERAKQSVAEIGAPKTTVAAKPVAPEPAPQGAADQNALPAEPLVEVAETPAADSDEGLSLRFGSDRDFLRLIAKGDVGVYLFQDEQAFRLGRNYAFVPSTPPAQLYELLPQTIPAAIHAAAGQATTDLTNYRWGVVMPGRIASRIEALVALERTGQLVINRFGEVQHQSAPALRRAEG